MHAHTHTHTRYRTSVQADGFCKGKRHPNPNPNPNTHTCTHARTHTHTRTHLHAHTCTRTHIHAHAIGRRFKQMAFAKGNGMQLNFDYMDELEDTDTQDWPVAPTTPITTTTTTTITAPEVVSWVKSTAPPRPPPRPSPGCCRQLASPYVEFKKTTLTACCCNAKKKSTATQRVDVVHTQGFRWGRGMWAGVITDLINRIMRLDLCAMTVFLFVVFALILLFMTILYTASFPLDYNPLNKNEDKCGNHR